MMLLLLLASARTIKVEEAIDLTEANPLAVAGLSDRNFDKKLKAGAPMLVYFACTCLLQHQ